MNPIMEPPMCKGSRELHGDKKGCCCLIKLHGAQSYVSSFESDFGQRAPLYMAD